MTHVCLLPLAEPFAQRRGTHRLVVSGASWNSPAVIAILEAWPDVDRD